MNHYDSTYDDLLEKYGYPNMNLRRQRTLCIEIYKTLNKLNPGYMNDIFKLRNTDRDRLTRERYKLNLEIPKPSQVTFAAGSLRSCGLKIWNALPYHIKTSDNFKAFIMETCSFHCTCRVCEHTSSRQ